MLKAGRDPLRWSAAQARDRVREALRRCLTGRHCPQTLSEQLARALKDDYQRHGSKKARDWPHKKKEKPPGSRKITADDERQKLAARKVKAKITAT
jgi:hypothetical protein